MIPLNQLIPECLLALGGAFLLGNLAAYIRLRPEWREARRARTRPAAKGGGGKARAHAAQRSTRATATAKVPQAPGGATAPRSGSREGQRRAREPAGSGTLQGQRKPREPTRPGSKLPSRARVLANVLIGLVITVAALATLLRG